MNHSNAEFSLTEFSLHEIFIFLIDGHSLLRDEYLLFLI